MSWRLQTTKREPDPPSPENCCALTGVRDVGLWSFTRRTTYYPVLTFCALWMLQSNKDLMFWLRWHRNFSTAWRLVDRLSRSNSEETSKSRWGGFVYTVTKHLLSHKQVSFHLQTIKKITSSWTVAEDLLMWFVWWNWTVGVEGDGGAAIVS